jgi:hypothetical protein
MERAARCWLLVTCYHEKVAIPQMQCDGPDSGKELSPSRTDFDFAQQTLDFPQSRKHEQYARRK